MDKSYTKEEIDNLLLEIRLAFAKHKYSAGCGCCRNENLYNEAEERLAKLLNVPMYKDGSGYDWDFYETKK